MKKIDKINELIQKVSQNSSTKNISLLFIEIDSVLEQYFRNNASLLKRFSEIKEYFAFQINTAMFLGQEKVLDTRNISTFLNTLRDRIENENESNEPIGYGMDALISCMCKTIEEIVLADPCYGETKSRTIPAHIRKFVIERDKSTCQICGNEVNLENIQLDHIFPYALGGANNELNLMVICANCNQEKGAKINFLNDLVGRMKLQENIRQFILSLTIAHDFKSWLISQVKIKHKIS
ncbi:MAG TPA: HNH endonuclease [Candidatus Lokiarchaeia archaeon]|nr:HNH endonuclease [Candidatus Lokiarchaeia archaeon]